MDLKRTKPSSASRMDEPREWCLTHLVRGLCRRLPVVQRTRRRVVPNDTAVPWVATNGPVSRSPEGAAVSITTILQSRHRFLTQGQHLGVSETTKIAASHRIARARSVHLPCDRRLCHHCASHRNGPKITEELCQRRNALQRSLNLCCNF